MDSRDHQTAAPLPSFLDNCYSGRALLGEMGWTLKPWQQCCSVWLKVHSQRVYGYKDCVKEINDFICTCMYGCVCTTYSYKVNDTGGVCCAIYCFVVGFFLKLRFRSFYKSMIKICFRFYTSNIF